MSRDNFRLKDSSIPVTTEIWLPNWVGDIELPQPDGNMEDQMRFVIDLSRRNVDQRTGGPFGAAVFEKVEDLQDTESWRLISIGVNQVERLNSSLLHAEIVAILYAQRQFVRSYDLSRKNRRLVTSAQPCIQCYGALFWTGLRECVFGARTADVESILPHGADEDSVDTFNEGPLPENWVSQVAQAPVPMKVFGDVLREEACEVLQVYADSGGLVYNAGAHKQRA